MQNAVTFDKFIWRKIFYYPKEKKVARHFRK